MAKHLPERGKKKGRSTGLTQKDKKDRYWKALRIGAIIGMIEALSLVLWIKSEDFDLRAAHFLRSLATCGFLAGAAYLAHKLTGGRFRKWIIGLIWVVWGLLCAVALFTESGQPKPHFTVSLQIGDSSDAAIVLTNESLFKASIINTITNFSDGFSFVNGVPVAVLLLPMLPGETNTVFTFIAKNDSPLMVGSVEMAVAFPADWKLGFDPEKWREAKMNLFDLGYELALTNFQCRMAICLFAVYPGDKANFPPITNFGTIVWHGPSTKIENFRLLVRSPGFEQDLAANFVFFTAPSNGFRPLLIPEAVGKDRALHPLISTDEFLTELSNSVK
jgi:hypothetical protein